MLGLLGIESEVKETFALSETIKILKIGHTKPLLEEGAWCNVYVRFALFVQQPDLPYPLHSLIKIQKALEFI